MAISNATHSSTACDPYNCIFLFTQGHHGEGQCAQRCAQVHVQCREEGQEAGHDQAVVQGDHQVPDGHAASWLVLNLVPHFNWQHSEDTYLISAILLGYIGEFEYVDDHRAGKIVVELNGRLNKCGVISPRFDVGVKEIEGWTARLLPSRQVSLLLSISWAALFCMLDSLSGNCALICSLAISCLQPLRELWITRRPDARTSEAKSLVSFIN
jgi:small subunit ribosomal protein S15Ae